MVYAIKKCTTSDSDEPLPLIPELRERFTYNIYPCGLQPANEVGGAKKRPMAPLPSRGGSFAADSSCDESRTRTAKHSGRGRQSEGVRGEGVQEDNEASTVVAGPLPQQIRYLNKQYTTVARQPAHIRCDLQLTPPIARAFCPQQQRDSNPVPYYTAYAADVPLHVIRQSRIMSGFDHLLKVYGHRREPFVLSCSDAPLERGARR